MRLFCVILSFILFYPYVSFPKNNNCKIRCSFSQNTWLPHAFSSSSLRDLQQAKYLWNDIPGFIGQNLELSVLVEYGQNFSERCDDCKGLGSMPFWSGTNRMTFGNNNGKADIDAYQLGLGNLPVNQDGISGKIELDPKVRQAAADLFLYYVYSKENPSIYFKIHAPLVAMTIAPHFKETDFVTMSGSNKFEQVTQPSDPNNLATSASITYYDWRYPIIQGQNFVFNYLTGGAVDCQQLDGNIFKPLRLDKGRIAPQSQTEIRLADLSCALGYNFVVREGGFFGAAFKLTCPTGNIPTADFMLEPIVGRGGAWGVGVELSGEYKIWQNVFDTDRIDLWLQGEVLHLIPGRRANMRSFDLKQNGPGSKYLLVQHYAPQYQYKDDDPFYFKSSMQPEILYSAIDVTTLPVFSKIAVEGAFSALLDYHHKSWNISLGAEFWGRSAECLSIDVESAVERRHPNLNEFAVMGRQHGSYLIDGNDKELFTYYCQPLAKINESDDPVVLVGVPPYLHGNYQQGFVQPGVIAEITKPLELSEGIADARISKNRIPAKFEDALDICGAQLSSAISGKLFGQIGYTFEECTFSPYLAMYSSVELTGKTNHALDMWSVGLQAGLNF
ncbi:hypothetical protein HYV10_03455 [Candidatus Dependentiae bacterium]|nr:hypothetical protein [Candidatus Dependentiae bacterium]